MAHSKQSSHPVVMDWLCLHVHSAKLCAFVCWFSIWILWLRFNDCLACSPSISFIFVWKLAFCQVSYVVVMDCLCFHSLSNCLYFNLLNFILITYYCVCSISYFTMSICSCVTCIFLNVCLKNLNLLTLFKVIVFFFFFTSIICIIL